MHSFKILNARSEELTRTVTWSVRDSANATRTTASGTGATYSKTYSIISSDTATNTAGGDQWNIITTLADGHNISAAIFGVSSLLTADNIWHSKLTTASSEDSSYFIGADNMQVKTHVVNVRNENKVSADVTTVVIDPDSSTSETWGPSGNATGADGYTGFQRVIPSAPSGTWTIRSSATDTSNNSSATYEETITFISSFTSNLGMRSIGWNQTYHKADTATFLIQTLTKNSSDDWVVTNVDAGTTPYYEIQYWDGDSWEAAVARTNMTAKVGTSSWEATYAIPDSASEVGKLYSVSFNATLNGAPVAQLKEFAVVDQSGTGDPITVSAAPTRAVASDTVRLTIRESNLNATVRPGNAAGTKVYIYDPSQVAKVNGSSPTELGNGVYYYDYSLGASPAKGVWQAVITTDSNQYSAATNFEVNDALASQASMNTLTTDVATVKSDVKTLTTDVATVKSDVNTLQTDNAALTTAIDELESLVNTKVGAAATVDAATLRSIFRELLQNEKAPLVDTYYSFGSIILNIVAINPSQSTTDTVAISLPLPPEVKPEHIIKVPSSITLAQNSKTDGLVATGQVTMARGDVAKLEIEIKDIFEISEKVLTDYEDQATLYYRQLEPTSAATKGLVLKNDILTRIGEIRSRQASVVKAEDKVTAYRDDLKSVDVVKKDIEKMNDLLENPSSWLGGIQGVAGWAVTGAAIMGILLFGYMFVSMWQNQMLLTALAMGVPRRRLREVGLHHNPFARLRALSHPARD